MGKQLDFKEVVQTATEPTASPLPPSNEPSWKGNKAYFQTGKKAGQLKPTATPPEHTKEPVSNTKKSETDFLKSMREEAAKASANRVEQPAQPSPSPSPSLEVQNSEPQMLITGYMLLVICEAFIPKIVSKVIVKKQGDFKKLTPEQLKEMRPLADEAAKMMFKKMNPVAAFFVSYFCVTLANNS